MFDLKSDSKGYFPHFFNRAENWNYEGPLAPTNAYGCDSMGNVERKQFMAWYEEEQKSGKVFNFRDEINSTVRKT